MIPQISRKRKSFEDCSGKQKRRIRAVQGVAANILCCDNLEVTGVQLRNRDTGSTDVVQVNKQSENENIDSDTLHKVLYAKERFSISNKAYHELSMLDSTLPQSWKLKAEVKEMNKRCKILPTPCIGSRQHIITFGFTIIDEGSLCKSAPGNYSVCIARVAEDCANLCYSSRYHQRG